MSNRLKIPEILAPAETQSKLFNDEHIIDTSWQAAFNGAPIATAVIDALGVTYIGEVTPLTLRGIFTCLSTLSYTIGPLIVALIVNETGDLPNRWAYRAIFLASKDRDEAALKSLNNLGHRGDEGQKRLAAIKHTLAQVISKTLIDRVGRRSLTFYGLFVLTIILFATGSLAIFADREPGGPEARAKISYIFGVLAIISLVFLWFYYPETAGRIYEELDEMFIKQVPARKFKSYQPNTTALGKVVKAAFEKEELQGEVTHRA
ncbi:hypothetical protein D7B24_002534 [Verticillium nonalfalfae]|uniref:Major facilitator superfamily (MFS) profile domain-containing protein n=1 Tax=Verticillium nonalfalfae TaxID=1051616 RepID=A0A3M9XXM7_9PEZI|nr:uncharacterized protein D7B24_002534 [Verticillium nonalfalfae]RNJ53027.1 hypothetical protein D7B24_002534 [Verticillium nonalfalfae]